MIDARNVYELSKGATSAIKSIQTGVVATGSSNPITISPVNISKSVIILSSATTGIANAAGVDVYFTSPSTIAFTTYSSAYSCHWQVVEYF